MTESSVEAVSGAEPADRPVGRDRAQYVMCVILGILGVVVVISTAMMTGGRSSSDVIGPKPAPYLVGGLMIIVAGLYAWDVARGGRGEPEEGEDVDLAVRPDWRTVLLLIAVFAGNAVLMEILGWVITGPLLFAGSAWALGNRRHLLALAIGIALALGTFYGFAIGLGVNLPAGILQGIL